MVKSRVLGAAAVSTASKVHEAFAKLSVQDSVEPIKHLALFTGKGEVLTVPKVTLPALPILSCRLVMPPENVKVSPPTQPVGESVTVTLPE